MDKDVINIPNHVAIIMDGNRRWAKERGLSSLQGHQAGFENIKKLASHILEKGVTCLSVFAFSTENFKRDASEVKYLMDIFVNMFRKECETLHKKGIKVIFSGRKNNLRPDVLDAMEYITEKTANNTKGVFNVCLNYGGQQEIVDATKKIVEDVKRGKLEEKDIDVNLLYQYMYQELPPIDFLIRTSGEVRLSNFMLYELSYAEIYFTKTYFPAFHEKEFDMALEEYQRRNRRFGGNGSWKLEL